MKIKFVLVGEGTSDLRLVDHIESILIEEGFSEASGEAPDLSRFNPAGRDIRSKIECITKHFPESDLIFIHRDSDSTPPQKRENEIYEAAKNLTDVNRIIPIIPVTMLETWLLADIEALKQVAGNPKFNGNIKKLQKIQKLEEVRDSKQLLLEVLCTISETEGSRLQKFKKRFPEMRARITYGLDPNGPIRQLPSYQSFRKRISAISEKWLANNL